MAKRKAAKGTTPAPTSEASSATKKPLRQRNIPGIDLRKDDAPRHPKLDVKIDEYYGFVLERLRIQAGEEKPRKTAITDMLREAGLSAYETPDGIQVSLDVTYGIKVKKKKDAEGGDVDEGGLGEGDEFDA